MSPAHDIGSPRSASVRAAGVAIANNPLDRVLEFQGRAAAQTNPHADGCLTATYPEVEKEDGRVISNYPNQGRLSLLCLLLCLLVTWFARY